MPKVAKKQVIARGQVDRTKKYTLEEACDIVKKAAGLETKKKPGSGSKEPNKTKVGKVSMKQVRELAQQKMGDMNCTDIESAMRTVMGTARSMGIDIGE